MDLRPKFLDALRQGIDAWRQVVGQHPDLRPPLAGADLAGHDLANIDLRDADLMGASLSGAQLQGVVLAGADLTGADLTGANLSGLERIREATTGEYFSFWHTKFRYSADLTGGIPLENLIGVYPVGTNLSGAILRRATFTSAVFGSTILANTDLSESVGLGECTHLGPSVVDHWTLMRSGPLPLSFLRGCGLPDSLIEVLSRLRQGRERFQSCFISYSRHDQDFADRLYADLQAAGVRCWFAPRHIQGGRKLHEQIDAAIRDHDRLLLILSEHSMASEWVKTEIARARQRNVREKPRMLFPVSLVPYEAVRDWRCFDADTGKDSASEVREYFIPDFSNWKDHDAYQEAFARLLRDLKAEAEGG